MAQLKDDCFAFGGDLLPLHEALAAMRERVSVVTEPLDMSIDQALGRILSVDVIARRNVPPHDNSAVDGYAVYFDDLEAEAATRLPYTGRIAAGHPLGRPAVHGEALRIFTGAPMPIGPDGGQASGPDTVFMEEDVTVDDDRVILPPGLKRGANRRRAGEDIGEGSVILTRGRRLRPQDLGLAASVGLDSLSVYSPLRVAVFSTGDEIRDPSGDAPEGCVFDANRTTVKGLLNGLGCVITDLGILGDNQAEIERALLEASNAHDMLITSGGVSAGEEDHVKSAVEANGNIHHWRLAIKPGRPIALGQVGRAAFVGLPGNPVAAMVTFMVLARPLVLWMSGASDATARRYDVTSAFDYKKKSGRREWVRVRLEQGAGDTLIAYKDHSSGAGILTSMVGADGLVELPEDVETVSPGDHVPYLPFNEVTG
ncbi:MAG: molybdopterin molybdotransferase MoeA [Alphaproteobacteria bacterium]|nr:molybdopterin molybdotransferase MoeA [Alphaproteobacteria bacterium]